MKTPAASVAAIRSVMCSAIVRDYEATDSDGTCHHFGAACTDYYGRTLCPVWQVRPGANCTDGCCLHVGLINNRCVDYGILREEIVTSTSVSRADVGSSDYYCIIRHLHLLRIVR